MTNVAPTVTGSLGPQYPLLSYTIQDSDVGGTATLPAYKFQEPTGSFEVVTFQFLQLPEDLISGTVLLNSSPVGTISGSSSYGPLGLQNGDVVTIEIPGITDDDVGQQIVVSVTGYWSKVRPDPWPTPVSAGLGGPPPSSSGQQDIAPEIVNPITGIGYYAPPNISEVRSAVLSVDATTTLVGAPGPYKALRIWRAEVRPDDDTGTPYIKTSDGSYLGVAGKGNPTSGDAVWQHGQLLNEGAGIVAEMNGSTSTSFAVHTDVVSRTQVPSPPSLTQSVWVVMVNSGVTEVTAYLVSKTGTTLATVGPYSVTTDNGNYKMRAAMSPDGTLVALATTSGAVICNAVSGAIITTVAGSCESVVWDASNNLYTWNTSAEITSYQAGTYSQIAQISAGLGRVLTTIDGYVFQASLNSHGFNAYLASSLDTIGHSANSPSLDFVAQTDGSQVVTTQISTATVGAYFLSISGVTVTTTSLPNTSGQLTGNIIGVASGILYSVYQGTFVGWLLSAAGTALTQFTVVGSGFTDMGAGSVINGEAQSFVEACYNASDKVCLAVANAIGTVNVPVPTSISSSGGVACAHVLASYIASPAGTAV
jgi:hypothetical protein